MCFLAYFCCCCNYLFLSIAAEIDFNYDLSHFLKRPHISLFDISEESECMCLSVSGLAGCCRFKKSQWFVFAWPYSEFKMGCLLAVVGESPCSVCGLTVNIFVMKTCTHS